MTSLDKLKRFRQAIYYRLGNAREAVFDLMDAALTTRSISSSVERSLSPLFRRKWPSLYEALQDAHPSRQIWMREYAEEMPTLELIVLVGDHTAWSRIYAKPLREHTYEHQPQPLSSAKLIILGQGTPDNKKNYGKIRVKPHCWTPKCRNFLPRNYKKFSSCCKTIRMPSRGLQR